jgi:hypothetical protein
MFALFLVQQRKAVRMTVNSNRLNNLNEKRASGEPVENFRSANSNKWNNLKGTVRAVRLRVPRRRANFLVIETFSR